MDRSRYTLPPFGAQSTLAFWQDRVGLFAGYGGVNAWKPDNSIMDLADPDGQKPASGFGKFRRDTSFNDAWLSQNWFGGKFALDHDQRVWLVLLGHKKNILV